MYQTTYSNQEYRQQQVRGASPIHLVVMAYDLAIRACEHEDAALASKAINALRDALDFEYEETALGLFKVYQWCLDCLNAQNYNEPIRILRDLREAWASVENKAAPMSEQATRAMMTSSRFQRSG